MTAAKADQYKIENKAFIDIRLRPGIATPLVPYGPLRPNVMSYIKWKYITYCNAARGGPSHGHRGYAQKICEDQSGSSRDIFSWTDRHTQTETDTQTSRSQYSTPLA